MLSYLQIFTFVTLRFDVVFLAVIECYLFFMLLHIFKQGFKVHLSITFNSSLYSAV